LASPACFAYEQLPHADCAPRVPLYHPQLQLSFAAWPRLLGRYCASWQSRATSPRNKVETTPPSALPACMSTRILCEQPPVCKEPHRREAATAAQQSPVSSSRKPFSPSANITQQSPASFSRKSSNWSSSVSKSFVKTSGAQPCAQASLSRGRRVPLFLQAAPVRCLHTFPHSLTTCSGSFSCSFTFCSHDDKSPRLNISPPAIFIEYQECRVRCMCSASSQSCLLDPAHWGVLQPISREPRPHPH